MKINRNALGNTRFADLKFGDVFTFGGNTYMLTNSESGDNCVNLENGEMWYVYDEELVTPHANANLSLE